MQRIIWMVLVAAILNFSPQYLPAETIFENPTEQFDNQWYTFRHNLKTGEKFYINQAMKKIRRYGERLDKIRVQSHHVDKESSGVSIDQLEENFKEARHRLGILKKATPEGWEAARLLYEQSIDKLEASFDDTAEKTLPEKEAYEWQAEDEMMNMKYDVAEFKEASKQMNVENPQTLDRLMNRLEEKQKQAENKLNELKRSDDLNWKVKKDEVSDSFGSFREVYFNALAALS